MLEGSKHLGITLGNRVSLKELNMVLSYASCLLGEVSERSRLQKCVQVLS